MPDKVKTTGRPDDCSLDELAALKEMITRVAQDKSCEHVDADHGASGFDNGAIPPHNILLRFLRARKFDVDLAMEMFLANREWRKNGVQKANTTLQEFDDPNSDIFIHKDKLDKAREQWQFGYHNTDNEGRPIYIDRIGQCDIEEMLKHVTIEQFLDWHIYQWEECLDEYFTACSVDAGRLVETNFSILDLKGFRVGYLSNDKFKEVFKTVAKLDSDNYPECMGKFFIINAPFAFRMAWKILKNFLDERTVSKITVLGDTYMSELTKFVSADKLPSFLKDSTGEGGTCECPGGCLTAAPGPWKDMNWRSPKRCGKCHHSSVLGEEVLELSRARVKGEPPGVIVSKKKLQLIQDEKDNHLFDDIPESPGDMAPEEMERL